MKTRIGFVSNSSSSSFLIIFDEPPDKKYLKDKLEDDVRVEYCVHRDLNEVVFKIIENPRDIFRSWSFR